jgi:hypothetical protein
MSVEVQDEEMIDAPVLEEPKEHDLDHEFSIRVVSSQLSYKWAITWLTV